MPPFAWGLLLGVIASLLLAAGVGVYAYRRIVLLERQARQSERLAELGTLTGGLAHELKNPLSTISLNLELLREDISPDDPANGRLANRIATVQREALRLRGILDDFLRYGGKMELNRQPTDLNELCEDLVDFFVPQAQLQRVQLRLRRSETPVMANIDPKLTKQAVLNLMINALQAMNQAGEIILSVRQQGPWGVVEVMDTGAGIPEEVREMLFVAYYTTKRSGTGLGLAMTRRIIEEHGGQITFKSELGKGTSFTIQLPMK